MTNLLWYHKFLSGTIPSMIGPLSALTVLSLSYKNTQSGELPPELGNLTSLINLDLHHNSFSGAVPSNLAKLINLGSIDFSSNYFTADVPSSGIYNDKEEVGTYLAMLKPI